MHTSRASFSDPKDKEELIAATIRAASVIDDGEAAAQRSQESKNILSLPHHWHISKIR